VSSIEPTRPPAGRQARAEATRQRILDETVACILEEGYPAASAKHIAERAGVTWGVIQYHFGDRSGIFASVTAAGLAEFTAEMDAVAIPEGPLRARLEAIVEAGARAFTSPLSLASFQILMATRRRPDAALGAQAEPFAREVHRLAAKAAPRHNPTVSRVLLSGLRGIALVQMVAPITVDSRREQAALVDVLLAYLESEGHRDRPADAPDSLRPASLRRDPG
jgi:AcrR family transcriptional regulator